MKKRTVLLISLIVLVITGITTSILLYQRWEEHEEFEEGEEENEEKEAAFTEARARYDFEMLKDPLTGIIPPGIFTRERAFARAMPSKGEITNPAARGMGIAALNGYLPAGPNNVGGRTRAVQYDLRYGASSQVIIAGCVSGGIMRSANGGNTWIKVTPEEDTHSFTSIAQDPRAGWQDTWYAGGGEPFGNTASEIGAPYLGNGLWKSTDNGLSWTKLPNNLTDLNGTPIGSGVLEAFDHPFDYVHKIAINPTNGDVYVAGHRRLLRSTNGGASFQTVFGNTQSATATQGQMDVAVTTNGKIFVAVNGGNPETALRGIWISNTGTVGSFTRIAGGQTPGVDLIAGWRANSTGDTSRRILIALAPSNQNTGYVFYENGLKNEVSGRPEADLFRFDVSGNNITWINRSANMPDFPGGNLAGSDPLSVQNGYDMLLAVKPNDPNTVFVGGTNLYRSTDGFASTGNTTWINGYRTDFSYTAYANGHPDQHVLVFNPANTNEIIVGDDGGIRRSTNSMAGTVAWNGLPNYQTLQYYYVDIDPETGRNNFAGGAQDNGVQLRDKIRVLGTPLQDSNNHVRLTGGDGGSVGISKLNTSDNTQYLYGSSQFGDIRRVRLSPSFNSTDIKPNNLTPNSDGGYGEFVTNFKLNPDNTEDLYYVNFNRLFRTTAASMVTSSSWTELTATSQAVNPNTNGQNISIRAMAFTRGAYTTAHSLFFGTTNGKIFRLDDPRNASPGKVPVNITPVGLLGNVQDIAVNPTNDNEILAVISNYNTISIWWTNDAKAAAPSWRNAEGNLTLPSIRSCEIVVNTSGPAPATEYYVGTSVGLYSVTDLSSILLNNQTPTWQREGGPTLNYAVVQSMALRPSDNTLVIGTHGNGMFYTIVGQTLPVDPGPGSGSFITSVTPTILLPSTGEVRYHIGNLPAVQKIVIQLFNMKGQLLYKREDAYQNGSVGLRQYPAGMYIISIISADGKHTFSQKLLKQ